MNTSNATLTSLWVDDGQGSPMKIVATTPAKYSSGAELKDDTMQFYRNTGLEPIAKEAGTLDANGELTGYAAQPKGAVQMIAVPISSPAKTPFKLDQPALYPKAVTATPTGPTGSPMILGTPTRILSASHLATQSPRAAQLIAAPVNMESPQSWSAGIRKRPVDLLDPDFIDGKRAKKGEKGGKGLRHFSMKVCEKVQRKGVTSYNEVADELVTEFSDPRTVSPTDQAYDQKNIRRRVYDALNVLMAMNIISKEKKEIRWIGLPTNSAQECNNLELEKQRRLDRIKHKTQQLQELILQQIAFKNLVQRNRQLEQNQGPPASNSAIQLPFIIVNTSKKTVIDCSISNDKYEYLFNFDNTFEIHDDIEVLKRMGMAFGLEKGRCSQDNVKKAIRMVPKSLEPYVLELAQVSQVASGSVGLQAIAQTSAGAAASQYRAIPQSPLAIPLHPSTASLDQSADAEVALATAQGLSRQSSIGSYSDIVASRDSPSDPYSEESESERSSPVDMN